jgi:hypothetical protein
MRRAAAALGLTPESLEALLARSGAAAQAEALRERRREELRRRATLAERAHLVLESREDLLDLGLLAELERDLASRLPDHLRALAAAPGPIGASLARSLSLPRAEAEALAGRLGVDLAAPSPPPSPPPTAPPKRAASRAHRGRGRPSRRSPPAGPGRRRPI